MGFHLAVKYRHLQYSLKALIFSILQLQGDRLLLNMTLVSIGWNGNSIFSLGHLYLTKWHKTLAQQSIPLIVWLPASPPVQKCLKKEFDTEKVQYPMFLREVSPFKDFWCLNQLNLSKNSPKYVECHNQYLNIIVPVLLIFATSVLLHRNYVHYDHSMYNMGIYNIILVFMMMINLIIIKTIKFPSLYSASTQYYFSNKVQVQLRWII